MMLMAVNAKPTQFMEVRAVPMRFAGAAWEASAENWGESATTKKLHAARAPNFRLNEAVDSNG
jgi:hypothetical protein